MKEILSDASDELIVVSIQKGDKDVFGVLMHRYQDKLLRYGRRFLSNQENIEDIVQDVFVSTYQNINNFDTSLKFQSWIYRIAHNAFVNALKKQGHSPIYIFDFDILVSHPVYEEPPLTDEEYAELKVMIDTGLEKLVQKYREVLILHYLEEIGYREIADILEIPIGTVGIRIKRAKEALRKVYDSMNIKYEPK